MAIRAVGTDKNGTHSIGYLRRYKNTGKQAERKPQKKGFWFFEPGSCSVSHGGEDIAIICKYSEWLNLLRERRNHDRGIRSICLG